MWTFRQKQPEPKPFITGVESGAAHNANQKVIVIGAGAAGLSAARVLHDQGCEVVVLEGRNRTGGRLNTMTVGGGSVDEGGNWIHGGPANPLNQLATDAGLDVNVDNFVSLRQVKTFDKLSDRSVNPLKVLYFLFRAERVAVRYAKEGLSATHRELNLGERLDNEMERIPGAANKRQYRSLLRTMVDPRKGRARSSTYLMCSASFERSSIRQVQPGARCWSHFLLASRCNVSRKIPSPSPSKPKRC